MPDDVAMKLKLYQILASLPNSDAQQVRKYARHTMCSVYNQMVPV